MAVPIRVIVADDHPVLRSGLAREIERDAQCVVVGEAGDGVAALALIRSLRPDVAVLDLDMPELDGLGVARAVAAERIAVAIVFLTMHNRRDMFNSALQLGARGYILKDSAVTELRRGIATVAAGQPYVSAPMMPYLLQRHGRADAFAERTGLDQLTPAERRILLMVADGRSSREIGEALSLHFRTIENRRTSICQKLGLAGPNALLKFALAHKHEL